MINVELAKVLLKLEHKKIVYGSKHLCRLEFPLGPNTWVKEKVGDHSSEIEAIFDAGTNCFFACSNHANVYRHEGWKEITEDYA